jgi:putative flippase GtrA
MATTIWRRFSRHRLARFGSVGVVATLVHASLLALLLLGLERSRGEANLIAFLAAFAVSMLGQQRYTFQDRLQGRRINSLGLLILFLINASAAFGLGSLARGGLLLLLPLLPALINYVLLYVFSGNPRFRT